MSNRKRQLHRMLRNRDSITRMLNRSSILRQEVMPTSIDLVPCGDLRDGDLSALATVVSSRRAHDIRRAHELADFTGEAFGVYEDAAGFSIIVKTSDPPRADRWVGVARVEPRLTTVEPR